MQDHWFRQPSISGSDVQAAKEYLEGSLPAICESGAWLVLLEPFELRLS